MKVCIPSTDLKVSRNFGKAEKFGIVVIENCHIVSSEVMPNPGREKVKVPAYVAAFGITHVIAAGIGNPAIGALKGQGIEVISGAEGTVQEVLEKFMSGELTGKKMSCAGENKCGAQHPKD
jgi:predicted Fe-Mo cluster-binding NifX family protein